MEEWTRFIGGEELADESGSSSQVKKRGRHVVGRANYRAELGGMGP